MDMKKSWESLPVQARAGICIIPVCCVAFKFVDMFWKDLVDFYDMICRRCCKSK